MTTIKIVISCSPTINDHTFLVLLWSFFFQAAIIWKKKKISNRVFSYISICTEHRLWASVCVYTLHTPTLPSTGCDRDLLCIFQKHECAIWSRSVTKYMYISRISTIKKKSLNHLKCIQRLCKWNVNNWWCYLYFTFDFAFSTRIFLLCSAFCKLMLQKSKNNKKSCAPI